MKAKNAPIPSGVYCIRNNVTGDVYVGSSGSIRQRCKHHRLQLIAGTHKSPKLQAAWAQLGEECFEFIVLERVTKDEMRALEQSWIDRSQSTYNTRARVTANTTRRSPTAEARQAVAEKTAAQWADPAARALKMAGMLAAPSRGGMEMTAFGQTQTVGKWARQYGIGVQTLRYRVEEGWDPELALTTPVERRNPERRARHQFEDREWSTKELAAKFGMRSDQLLDRLSMGWTLERALTTPVRTYPRGVARKKAQQ